MKPIQLLKIYENNWAIHTTVYRVCCIKYIWLFVNAQFYVVFCSSHSKCIFLAFKKFDSTKPIQLLKNIWKHIQIFSIAQFDNTKPRTYIIGHNNPSVRILDLVSATTNVACVNFIHKGRDLQFKVDSERQNFQKLIMATLFTIRVLARNLLRRNRQRNTFCILFLMSGLGLEPWLYV